MTAPLIIAQTPDVKLYLLPAMSNRQGLITGATGTDKTVTLQKLEESFSAIGVPVFIADVKGDLTGIAAQGEDRRDRLAAAVQSGDAVGYLRRTGSSGAAPPSPT